MACYYPITAYRSREGRSANGKWPIVFNHSHGYLDLPILIPCSKCIGCKLERSRQWAVRCIHEAQTQIEAGKRNCFITLTYNEENLPEGGSLNLVDIQKFFKRLRKKYGANIRYFQCGEYGDKLMRPHHHICLFGFDFPDKKPYYTKKGIIHYRSESLERLWPFGFSELGDVTFESAAYTARYILKKTTGEGSIEHYENINEETGEVVDRKPEYVTMSRRPGLGRAWYNKYHKTDVYAEDLVRIRKGITCKPPRYYDSIYDIEQPIKYRQLLAKRQAAALKHIEDNTEERLRVREVIQKRKSQQLIRSYENENI